MNAEKTPDATGLILAISQALRNINEIQAQARENLETVEVRLRLMEKLLAGVATSQLEDFNCLAKLVGLETKDS